MKPSLLREVEPFDDPAETHGICDAHHGLVMRQLLERGPEIAELTQAVRESAAPPLTVADAGDDGVANAIRRLWAWMSEAPLVLGERLGGLIDDMGGLEARCVTAEAERDRLEREVARLQDEVTALRHERHALETTHREAARMATLLVELTIEHALQPLHALAARLRSLPTMRATLGDARRPVDSRDDSA